MDNLKILSDPSRIEILNLLKKGDASVSEIVEATGLSQPNVSAHLRVLRTAGLVKFRKDGKRVIYQIDTTVFQDVITWAQAFLS